MLKLRGKHSVPKFAILPHLMALVMLIIAGGAFTHIDVLPHSHDTQYASVETNTASHDHADSTSDSENTNAVSLHCGSNILALDAILIPAPANSKQLHEREKLARLTSRPHSSDPPPPRSYS